MDLCESNRTSLFIKKKGITPLLFLRNFYWFDFSLSVLEIDVSDTEFQFAVLVVGLDIHY